MKAELKIKRVLSVADTRSFEEIGDRWVPIPGSGVENGCNRCGRTHEVHWEVELSDGSRAVVGSSCAQAMGMDGRRVKGIESAAKTLARLKAQRTATEKRHEHRKAIEDAVCRLTLPEIVHASRKASDGSDIPVAQMGDAEVWCQFGGFTQERRDCLTSSWRVRRIRERTVDRVSGFELRGLLLDLDRRIEKQERKLTVAKSF